MTGTEHGPPLPDTTTGFYRPAIRSELVGPSAHEGTIRFDGESYTVKCECGWVSQPKPSDARAWYEFDTHQASGDW